MKFSKTNTLLIFLILSFFLIESAGFDFYAHSIIYYFNKEQLTHSYSIFNSNLILPRYGLLSSIYEFFSSISLPLGYVALFLLYYPIKDLVQLLNLKFYNKIEISKFLFILFISLLVFFYSGLTISILYIISFLLTKKKVRLLGIFFHPVTFFLFPIIAFFVMDRKSKFVLLLFYIIFIFFCFIFTRYQLQNSFSSNLIKFEIEISSIFELVLFTYDAKYNEINLMILVIIIFFIFLKNSKSIFSKMITYLNIKFFSFYQLSLILLTILISIQSYFFYNDRPTLLSSIYKKNNVIFISWFDFSEKDPNLSLDILMDQR